MIGLSRTRVKSMSEKIIYLNGSFVPKVRRRFQVDSGFNAGDGVYDVTRTLVMSPSSSGSYFSYRPLFTRIGAAFLRVKWSCRWRVNRNKPLLNENDDYAIWQVVSRGCVPRRGIESKVSPPLPFTASTSTFRSLPSTTSKAPCWSFPPREESRRSASNPRPKSPTR